MTDGNGGSTEPRRDEVGATGQEPGDELGDRMRAFGREAQVAGERFGREAQAAGERFGREAQAAGERLANDPSVMAVGTMLGRLWGLVLIVVGLWLLAEVSLGLDLPGIDWDLAWPVLLMVLGGLVILSAAARRR